MGAGGPTGAIMFGLGFVFLERVEHAYFLMGGCVLVSGLLTLVINIKGLGGILAGLSEQEKWRQNVLGRNSSTLTVPGPPGSVYG